MTRTLRILAILVAAAATLSGASAPRFVQVHVSFIAWSLETRVSQRPADIRAHPDVSVRTSSPACMQALLSALRLEDLAKAPPEEGRGDARLVVDLHDASGTMVTYYADRFELMSEDASLRRPIDERFQLLVGTRLFLGRETWCASLVGSAHLPETEADSESMASGAPAMGIGTLVVAGVLFLASVASLISVWDRPGTLAGRLMWSVTVLVPLLGPLLYAAIVLMDPSSSTPITTPRTKTH